MVYINLHCIFYNQLFSSTPLTCLQNDTIRRQGQPSLPSFMYVVFPYQGRTSENILDLSFDILTSSAMARNSRGKGKKAVVESEEEEEYTVEKILDRRSVLTF